MPETEKATILPAHIEGTVQAIARLHAEHHDRATPFQKLTASLTARAGRPTFMAWLVCGIVGWIVLNLGLAALGHPTPDPAPFGWLELGVSIAALLITVMILSTQRRDDELARKREHLTLELAILGDQKAAKIIGLLEELRRDHPSIHDRVDEEARDMSVPADPQAVLDAITGTNAAENDRNPSPREKVAART